MLGGAAGVPPVRDSPTGVAITGRLGGPPFTPARQKGRAPDGAVGQRGQQTTATAPSLSVRKDMFVGVTDGLPPGSWWVSCWLYCETLRTTRAAKH